MVGVGNDVIVEDVFTPQEFIFTKPLPLIGHGVTELDVHFLQIKHTTIGVYMEPSITTYLHKWKGKSGKELSEDDDFFDAIASTSVEIVIRVALIKEIKASQYGTQLEGAVKDLLAANDLYKEEEEDALEKVAKFFPTKYLKKGDTFIFKFTPFGTVEIVIKVEDKDELKMKVENINVANTIKKWYLGGTRGVSSSTVESIANNLADELSK